ncbi:VOC family protein [Virgibacillus sp. Bac330]|uniref:VOC family protein n=1 Tax=Virgibacillus sp. Bac330 TaxID=2419841 RepID=UPI001969B07A|nr:VOC family protein [Virgibacillus sp. Bac330]
MDHLVLTVESVEQSIQFYGDVLGMEIETFNQNRKAARFGLQKINFQEVDKEISPKASHPTPGSGDFCLITTNTPKEVLRQLKAKRVSIVLGPVQRSGALGSITSIYVRDPDQNLIEISSYHPHVKVHGK